MTAPPKVIRRDIIDNSTGGITMAGVLNSAVPHVGRLDVSTGYFNVAGYGLIRGALEGPAAAGRLDIRLLLGKGAVQADDATFESQAAEYRRAGGAEEALPVGASLDADELSSESRDSAAGLIGLLRLPNVQARLGTSRFNHSKCYILGDESVFVGSSNLTRGGLVGNHELNAGLYQPAAIAQARDWFERMWKEGEDAKEGLISVLTASKFGAPPEPFSVYMKMLFERFRPLLAEGAAGAGREGALTRFQQDAVRTGMLIVSDHGGAIIADATGLGKTNMGIEIVRQKILMEGKRVLLIAPAQVLRSMWAEKLKEVDINVRETLTTESLGRDSVLEGLGRYRNIDFVLIDESQNFRAKGANRRVNLMKLMSVGRRKQAVLLTATPINNSLMDLYYQLSIITGGNDAHFYRKIGIPNLYEHMRKAANRDSLQQGLEKIQQLLDSVMVRRTRSYIKEVYRDDTVGGREIRFPRHEYSPIRYSLSDMFGNIFERILEGVSSLTMAPYGIERYNTALPEDERDRHRVLGHLQVILLLKRFESSVEAARASLGNRIALYEHVGDALGRGQILHVGDFNRILARWRAAEEGDDPEGGGDERARFFLEEIGRVGRRSVTSDYDVEGLRADIDSDLRTLRALQDDVGRITMDTKLEEVERRIMRDRALDTGGRKVLIFTEYTTTARYITKDLREKFRGKAVECITGGTRPETRRAYIRRFAPEANLAEGEEPDPEGIDILVSTEVLSEGQNLQDCNYVINYDLPWNPMRIVQRTGRIDRLTSRHDVIRSRACYPDSELDAILELVGKLIGKIGMVNDVIGLDAELLGETPSPKQYNGTTVRRVRALASGAADAVVGDLERESDVMPATSPINELSRYIKERGMDFMRAAPMGRRSGKRGEGRRAVLAYLQESPERRTYFAICDLDAGTARVPDDDFEAIQAASCGAGEPLHLPMDGPEGRESFELLLEADALARAAISDRNDQVERYVRELGRERKGRHERNATRIKSIAAQEAMSGALPMEDADAMAAVARSEYARPWEDIVSGLLSEYERAGDARALAAGLRRLGESIGLDKKPAEEPQAAASGDPALRLVGAMFVTGDAPGGPAGGKGARPAARAARQ